MTPASEASPGRSRLLMIDDDKKLCRLVGDYLSPLGFDFTAADTHWQAVILDVMLPSLDGFEVLRRLRKSSDIPVLMLTARDDKTDRTRYTQLDATRQGQLLAFLRSLQLSPPSNQFVT